MHFDEIRWEITWCYKDYMPDYAYAFINGILYASRIGGKITDEQSEELSKLNQKHFDSKVNNRRSS